MNCNKSLKFYLRLVLTGYVLTLIIRLYEIFSINSQTMIQHFNYISTLYSIFYDLLFFSSLYAISYVFYRFLTKANQYIGVIFIFLVTLFFAYGSFVATYYYLFNGFSLDYFIFSYSIFDMKWSLNHAQLIKSEIKIILLTLFLLALTFYYIFQKIKISKLLVRIFKYVLIFSLPLFIFIQSLFLSQIPLLIQNKLAYFLTSSIRSSVITYEENRNASNIDINIYQRINPEKKFVDIEYPLIYEKDTAHSLVNYFKKFDFLPNIVMIIIKGLHDDLIQPFHGVTLMPFLKNLADSSLYWNTCYISGEYPYAVLPAILGGLPNASQGFISQKDIPLHLTILPVLKNNGYYTCYLTANSSRFRNIDRFMNYNQIDAIFDNKNFDRKYFKAHQNPENILLEDSILYAQALNIFDTLTKSHLGILYARTIQKPYTISDKPEYKQHFFKLLLQLPQKEKDFFVNNRLYIQSILYTDKALKQFFSQYNKIKNFHNTIFIITGDNTTEKYTEKGSLKKFQVPLIIYSPKLSLTQKFQNIPVKHADVPNSLMSILDPYVKYKMPFGYGIGNYLATKPTMYPFVTIISNINQQLNTLIYDKFLLKDNSLYTFSDSFIITPLNNKPLKDSLYKIFKTLRNINISTCVQNRNIPPKLYFIAQSKEVIYYKHIENKTCIKDEFMNLIDSLTITEINTDLNIHIQFDYLSKLNKGLTIVWQLTNSNDSLVYWKNTGIPITSDNFFLKNIFIPSYVLENKPLILKIYFWNQQNIKFCFKNAHVFVSRSVSN